MLKIHWPVGFTLDFRINNGLQTVWDPTMYVLTKYTMSIYLVCPEDDSLEPKHVAKCVLVNFMYVLCFAEQITYHIAKHKGMAPVKKNLNSR
jgi:hypothetical protein